MLLLLAVFVLFILTVVWFFYSPDITEQIDLSISSSQNRIISGDYIEYKIKYKNNSEKKLLDTSFLLNLPKGLLIREVEPADKFVNKNNSFYLAEILPGEEAEFKIGGIYYDTPNVDTHISVTMNYQQADRQVVENKLTNLIQVHRGSVLVSSVEMAEKILSNASTPIKITLKNEGQEVLENINLPIPIAGEVYLSDIDIPSPSIIKNGIWQIQNLEPGQSVTLSASLLTRIFSGETSYDLSFTPQIIIDNVPIDQATDSQKIEIVYPQVEMEAIWEGDPNFVWPQDVVNLNLYIKNNTNTSLENLQIELPLPKNIVNLSKVLSLNGGFIDGNSFVVNKNFNISLKEIKAGDDLYVDFAIPINYYPLGGNNLNLSIPVNLSSGIQGVANSVYTKTAESGLISIGTQVDLSADLRYFTDEGDQMGRGPLPPKVGESTKYWVLIHIKANNNSLKNLNFLATLPDYVNWTGKSSVSHGVDVSYDESIRQVSWYNNLLPAGEETGIYFELEFVPTSDQINTTPEILKNINFSAIDGYINQKVYKTIVNLDTTLPADKIGRNRGFLVR